MGAIAATLIAIILAAAIIAWTAHSGTPKAFPDRIVGSACAGVAHLTNTVDCNTALQALTKNGLINPETVKYVGTDLTVEGNTIIYRFRITLKNGNKMCYVVRASDGKVLGPC